MWAGLAGIGLIFVLPRFYTDSSLYSPTEKIFTLNDDREPDNALAYQLKSVFNLSTFFQCLPPMSVSGMPNGGENTMNEHLATHPELMGSLLTTLLLLSQGTMTVSAVGEAYMGP